MNDNDIKNLSLFDSPKVTFSLFSFIKGVGLNLSKVPNPTLEKLIASEGLYFCVLKTYPNWMTGHCIGINTLKKIKQIYDPSERYSLELNIDNLNRCCGRNKNFLSFMSVGKIVMRY